MSSEHSESDMATDNMQNSVWQKKHDVVFLLLTLGCLLLFIALFSYDPEDVAWSVVGSEQADNSAGRVGAYLADFLLHSLGYLAFAFPTLILAKAWLLFRKAPAIAGRIWLLRGCGLLITLASLAGVASISIWSGAQLPAGAGGILGQLLSDLLTPLFGFVGTALIYIVMLALGSVLFLEFSWLHFFERLGGGVLSLLDSSTSTHTRENGSVQKKDASSHSHSAASPVATPKQLPLNDSASLDGLDSQLPKRSFAQRLSGLRAVFSLSFLKTTNAAKKRQGGSVESNTSDREMNHDSPAADPLMDFSGFSATDDSDLPDSDIPPWESETSDYDDAEEPAYVRAQKRSSSTPVSPSVANIVPQPKKQAAKPPATEVLKPEVDTEVLHDALQEEALRIEPLEKRESGPSDRAKRDLQGSLFKNTDPLPSIALLDPPRTDIQSGFSEERLRDLSALLIQKLADFGVKIEVTAIAPGPVITRFEIQPAPGVKASKISNLAKDLARSMAMVAVRVVEVIPGKSVMGIEVPNENRAMVTLGEVLSTQDYEKSKSPLTLALGHDIAGNPVITDLAKMPHLLVAGTTGSGKSVGVNAMLISLLFKSTPADLRLILVDPKMLELSVYEGIPHLLTPVITDMKEAASGLRWSVAEMERRYQLMAAMGVRNLAGFNKKVRDAIEEGKPLLDPLWQIDQSVHTTPQTLEPLPYIVIVIDEFADMMMVVGKKVEELIARIAQKARAAGIHMVLATQRPSVDVITGLIKANVPTRIAFQVSSKIDSRTILDQGGAEQLLGHGDMLYMPPGCALPERVHGAFVDDDEVHRVVAEWKTRGEPNYLEEITQVGEDGSLPGEGGAGSSDGEQDELYDIAVALVIESGKCSISSVQRKLRIGYNRAARLVETMEAAGVVSPPAHNGSREVLAPSSGG
ncbi:MAG: DNA translocase FtsK 4TM domain-containing protein [Thalassolituus sp.]